MTLFGESAPQPEGRKLPDAVVPGELDSTLHYLKPFAATQRFLPKQALGEIVKLLADLLNRETTSWSVQV